MIRHTRRYESSLIDKHNAEMLERYKKFPPYGIDPGIKKYSVYIQQMGRGMRMFKKITLQNYSGIFVQEVTIPDFISPPEFIIWGARTFKFKTRLHTDDDIPASDVYIEVFSYTVVPIAGIDQNGFPEHIPY